MNATHDPTLDTLIPSRSTIRNLAWSLLALLIVAAAWFSPEVLRPSIVSESGGSSWHALAPHAQVVTDEQVQAEAWPNVGVEKVSDVPGARVVGAWLLQSGLAGYDDQIDPADFATPAEFLDAALPADVLSENNSLPRDLDRGTTSRLVVVWEITDCSLLNAETLPEVELRTAIGTTRREPLGRLSSPGFSVDTLIETGICPAR